MRGFLLLVAVLAIILPTGYVLHGGHLLWLWLPVFGLSYIITTEGKR